MYPDLTLRAPGWDIIIYPGQSNTAGGGKGPFVDTDPSLDGGIFQVGRFGANNMKIIPAVRPLDYVGRYFHSYDLIFARFYAAKYLAPERNIVIIPQAEAGTTILFWLDIVAGPYPLWSDLANRVALCMGLEGTNRIVGWWEQQGETDTKIAMRPSHPNHACMPDAETYRLRKLDLIDRARSDFGVFPMIFGLLPDDPRPNKIAFDEAIRAAAAQRPHCAVTETTGIQSNFDYDPSLEDATHFSAQGQEDLAMRHFESFERLVQRSAARRSRKRGRSWAMQDAILLPRDGTE